MFAGKVVSHFQVLEKIGNGGMGEVYLAQDTILGRRVALKFLTRGESDQEQGKILAEARAAAAIDHAYVCKIFETGEADGKPFIAMEFVEGETLEKRLRSGAIPLHEALPLAIEISEALAEAHRKGMVHCDLKPSNVMLTQDRHVKLMDFGLARAVRPKVLAPDDETLLPTSASGVIGTLAYMAPEQARAEQLDARADVFALGIILYEVLCGVHPFRKKTREATVGAILYEDPPEMAGYPGQAPSPLSEIVTKALAKDANGRYASAGELHSDLVALRDGLRREIVRTSAPKVPMVAILPFQDLSAAGDQGYFCDGLAEELIVALGRIESMRVVARSEAFRFRNAGIGLSEIGRALKATMILEGSVRKAGERVRIVVNLVNPDSSSPVWSERYDRQLDDIFEVQEEIARAVSARLRATIGIGSNERVTEAGTHNVIAYEAYLKGRYFWNRRTEENIRLSIEQFEKALTEDPDYALAWVGLSDAWITLSLYGAERPIDVMPRAKAAVERALLRKPDLAEALMSRGCLQAIFEWKWPAAELDFESAIALNPRSAQAHQWFAMNCLAPQRKFERARAELKMASELEPMSLAIATSPGILDLFQGNCDSAIARFRTVLELEESFYPARYFLGQAYLEKKLYGDAVRELERAVQIAGASSESLAALGYAQAVAGDERASRGTLQRLIDREAETYVSPVPIAQIQAGLGLVEEAVGNLRRALEVRATDVMWVGIRPAFAELRGDARVGRILSQAGLQPGVPATAGG